MGLIIITSEVQSDLKELFKRIDYYKSLFKDRKVLLRITLVLTHLRTYLLTYVLIFRRSHPALKLIKQKMSEILQVNVPNIFYFVEIRKMAKLGPKKQFWDLKIKIYPSGNHPNLILSFF